MKNTEITFCLRNPCNYSCNYCIGKGFHNPLIFHDMNKLSEIYQSIKPFISTVFECGTGEPTIHPQIKEILSLCGLYGAVSMPTNNSQDPEKWLSKEYARVLYLNITVHPQAEKKLENFLDRLIRIKEMGATISLQYVARPDRIKRFLNLKEYFCNKGFSLTGMPYTGFFNGVEYPYSYLEEEKKSFGITESTYWLHRMGIDTKIRNFEGIPCLAGSSSFCIGPETTLKRCIYDETLLDAPYKEAQPCRVSNCGCGLLLKELNHQTSKYWNDLRALGGYPLLETEDKDDNQLYQEAYQKYQELMKSYNKI